MACFARFPEDGYFYRATVLGQGMHTLVDQSTAVVFVGQAVVAATFIPRSTEVAAIFQAVPAWKTW
jgi:hypothetical protein